MACDVIHTGSQFLGGTLAHLDCQARTIGAYGYGALAQPGSTVSLALTGILTLFVALFGLRLLTGEEPDGRDLVGGAIRVGLFLALATSWPAWRVIGYELVLDGPAQIAGSIGLASALPGSSNDLIARLQQADDGIVSLTMFGSGRLTGGISAGADLGDAASGVALADQTALGWGRSAYLIGTIGAFALLRLATGLLLALAPLMAGLLLFAGTFGLFTGWLRGLAFCALGGVAFQVTISTELALLFPWLGDVLAQRQANVFTPSAPTELFVLAAGFGVALAGILAVIGRVTFMAALPGGRLRLRAPRAASAEVAATTPLLRPSVAHPAMDRAAITSAAVAGAMRRDEQVGTAGRVWHGQHQTGAAAVGNDRSPAVAGASRTHEPLGDSYRRATRRPSAAGRRRDQA